jgi:hypothetical protein
MSDLLTTAEAAAFLRFSTINNFRVWAHRNSVPRFYRSRQVPLYERAVLLKAIATKRRVKRQSAAA